MSDVTDIVSAMGGYQAATPQDKAALEAVLGSRGGRQRDGGVVPPVPAGPFTILIAGSSTPERAITAYSTEANGDDRVTFSTTGTGFTRLNNGRMCQRMGKKLADSTGRSIRYIATGKGGLRLSELEADPSSVISAVNAAGGADAAWLQVGYNDIAAGNPASKAAHLALLRSLIAKIRTGTGLNQLMIFIGITQDKTFTPELRYVREAEMTVINADPFVRFGMNQGDLESLDGIHITEAAYDVAADRLFLQMDAYFRGVAQVRGPRVIGTARVTDTTTDVTFQHGNGSDFTPTSGILGFSIYDASGALLSGTITGARQSSTVVRVTHPTGASSLEFYTNPLTAQAGVSDPNLLKDNGATPLPAEPSEALLAITGAGVTPVAISGTPGPATAGSAYSFVPTVTGGDGGRVFSGSGTLPTGFIFSTSTGSITAPSGNAATAGTYTYAITVTSAGTSATLNISIVVQAAAGGGTAPTGKEAAIDYGPDGSPVVTGYNRRQVSERATAASLVSPTGTSTGWTDQQITVTGGPSGNTGSSTGNNSGVFPDATMTSFWSLSNEVVDNDFAGLDDSKAYDIVLFGSRAVADRYTQYTINGAAQTLDCSNNTSRIVTFAKVRPTGGKIRFTWQAGTNNGTLSPFGYLSVAKITEFFL